MLSAALLGCLGTLAGCWTYTPAAPLAGTAPAITPIPEDAWKPRDIRVLQPLLDATPSEIHRYKVRDGVDPGTLSEADRKQVAKVEDRIVYKGIHGKGLVRVFETEIKGVHRPDTSGTYQPFTAKSESRQSQGRLEGYVQEQIYGFVGNARVITSRTVENPLLQETLENDRFLREIASVSQPDAKVVESGVAADTLVYAGVPVRIPPPRAEGEPKYRGLILHIHAIRGNEYEPKVMDELVRRGWAIVDFQTQTQLDPPLTPDQKSLEREMLETRREVHRRDLELAKQHSNSAWPQAFIQNSSMAFIIENGLRDLRRKAAFQACSPDDLDSAAAAIANEVDQAMAGASYAVEAVLDYIRTQRHDIPTHPLVLMGFSAGALGTPTINARLKGEPDAVVIVGGGANIFMLSQQSSLTDGGIRVRCGEKKIDAATREELSKLYLSHAKLDPYWTAPLLIGRPLLHVHARKDTWVPASGGELLFERMGGAADRLVINADHDLLFYLLPDQAVRIADWIDRAVAGKEPSHAMPKPPSHDAQK
jgi:hypothetical protein